MSSHFFLRLRNAGVSTLQPLYVNYGSTAQTVDNIVIPPDGVLYNIGYYRGFTSTEVRAYSQSAPTTYVSWSLNLPFVSNQSVSLLSTSFVARRVPAIDEQPMLFAAPPSHPMPAAFVTREPSSPPYGRLHGGRVRGY